MRIYCSSFTKRDYGGEANTRKLAWRNMQLHLKFFSKANERFAISEKTMLLFQIPLINVHAPCVLKDWRSLHTNGRMNSRNRAKTMCVVVACARTCHTYREAFHSLASRSLLLSGLWWKCAMWIISFIYNYLWECYCLSYIHIYIHPI